MRKPRLISAIVAIALAVLLPAALLSSPTAAAERNALADPARVVTINFGGGSGSFSLTGKVSPEGKGLKVSLQYKRTRGANWKSIKKDGTNSRARYGFFGLQKVGFFRVKVPQSRGYRTSYSKVVKVTKN
jgi:hypothetical protein